MRAIILLTLLPFATLGPSRAQEQQQVKPVPAPQAEVFTSRHQLAVGGRTVRYTATAGTMLMKNAEGEPIALFGYTAYVENDVDRGRRPLLFAYNGGPGSASLWLHMGILGPQRVVLTDAEFHTAGPFERKENEFSILDEADLVMIDPVGTGYAKAVGEAEGKDFWGVDQDIESVSDFIARYVTQNGRWASPKYLLGESYGGVRSGGVTYRLLSTHDLALNGVILVSPYMDYVAGNTGLEIDLAYVLSFTTYAATAWYHDALAERPESVHRFLEEAERFAETVYAPALFQGHRLPEKERAAVLAEMARLTGVSEEYWDRANLRMSEQQFLKELLRERRQTAGRIDSRFKGDSINLIAERFTYDPFDSAVGPAFVAAFNDYYRNILGVELDRRYVVSGGLWRQWDQSHRQPGVEGPKVPFANTSVDLAWAMVQNPNMRLLVLQGYYDLATPYGATDYMLDHLDIGPQLRRNITVEYYEAGHMMYIHPESMAKFKEDLAAFIH